jgi:hypothetical protein
MMFGSNPFTRYARAYYSHFDNTKQSYYEAFYKVVDVDQLLEKCIPDIQRFIKTASPIQILNIPFDTTPARLGRLLGTPKFKRTEKVHPLFDRTTFFYKRSYFKGKAIFQFNFLNELFVSCVVTFVQQKDSGERLFLKMINEKYLLSQDKLLDPLEGIIDREGNLLLFEESVYSSLVYVNAATVHKNIEKEIDEKLKLVNLLHWRKHYQNWSDNL